MSIDVMKVCELRPDEAYSIDPIEAEHLQAEVVSQRFEELRQRLPALCTLADDLRIHRLENLNDVIPLCFPHTMYKSYSVTNVEKGRYDRLSQWLDGLTIEDLSGVDVSGCDSLESWLEAIEAATPVQPVVSSGTTGKISFFPRSSTEADVFLRYILQAIGGFADEPDSRLKEGEPDWFSPIPLASGRQTFPRMFELIRRHCFDGDHSRIHTLGQGHWDADMLWLSGRMRAAEARGETARLALTPALERVQAKLRAAQHDAAEHTERFLNDLVKDRGRPVVIFAPRADLIHLARMCRDRGLSPDFRHGSFILTGGGSGSKGVDFPEDWEELLYGVFPAPHQELYGMTESTGTCRLCSAGWLHWPPTVTMFVLDPDTSQPLPRTGTQTGRLALFDLCARTYWGGTITGDRVTVDWDGGCPCGRRGPRVMNNVTRYSRMRDDDKITCSKSSDAYERAVETLTSLT